MRNKIKFFMYVYGYKPIYKPIIYQCFDHKKGIKYLSIRPGWNSKKYYEIPFPHKNFRVNKIKPFIKNEIKTSYELHLC